ncbi:glycosyltransferase family 4 protein [Lacinutrix sp.]|uniref:MraY family glycosyltransferase n=1 Tax=Lacinutrix sp. TaxID=1937692 RepID=UPI0035C81D8D
MIVKFIVVTISLFLIELLYLKIARIKNIKDTPNHRSAHKNPTLRGGGIIVAVSVIIYAVFFHSISFQFYFFLSATLLVAIISFIDDLIKLSSKLRLITHFIAFLLIFYSLNLFSDSSLAGILFIIFIYLFSIGFLNIYNFMDGINGITFLNALVSYSTLLYLNKYYIVFTENNLLITLIISILVFGFFNFRKKAICFAGDIGSITIGFSLIYFVLKLYLASNNLSVLLIFTVYLTDGVWTILERLYRRENIFEAHSRHLYQLLANNLKIDHLKVSTYYFFIQISINILLVLSLTNSINPLVVLSILALLLSIIYIKIKKRTIKKSSGLL